jgi:hypothetical protein
MNRRPLTIAVVAVLVLVAGCGGAAPDGDDGGAPTATTTPTATATSTTTSGTAEAPRYPPGWSPTGVTNASTALDAHYRAVLGGPPVAVTYRSAVIESTADRPNTTLDLRIDTADRRVFAAINGSSARREVFFADGTFTQWSVRNETVVARSEAQFGRVAQSVDRRVLTSQLLLYRLEPTGTVERYGTTAIVYTVAGVHEDALSPTYGAAESGSGRIVVTVDGRLIDLETRVTYESGTVAYRYTQAPAGEDAAPTPDWMPAT